MGAYRTPSRLTPPAFLQLGFVALAVVVFVWDPHSGIPGGDGPLSGLQGDKPGCWESNRLSRDYAIFRAVAESPVVYSSRSVFLWLIACLGAP